jgi:hypothetical protein
MTENINQKIADLRRKNEENWAATRARAQAETGMLNSALNRRRDATISLPQVTADAHTFIKSPERVNAESRAESDAYNRETATQVAEIQGEYSVKSAAAGKSSGGGGGCFITTATVEALGLDNGEDVLNEFRGFRDNWLAEQKGGNDLIAKYYETAPAIVDAVGSMKSVYLLVWEKYLKPCRDYIKNEKNDDALNVYRSMCNDLEGSFL